MGMLGRHNSRELMTLVESSVLFSRIVGTYLGSYLDGRHNEKALIVSSCLFPDLQSHTCLFRPATSFLFSACITNRVFSILSASLAPSAALPTLCRLSNIL